MLIHAFVGMTKPLERKHLLHNGKDLLKNPNKGGDMAQC